MEPQQQPEGSRFLESLKKQAEKKHYDVHPAINFSAFYEEKQND